MKSERRWLMAPIAILLLFLVGEIHYRLTTHKSVVVAPQPQTLTSQSPRQNPVGFALEIPSQSKIEGQNICRYNTEGDKVSETDPTGKTTCYVYDQNHHPIRVIDPQGHSTYLGR